MVSYTEILSSVGFQDGFSKEAQRPCFTDPQMCKSKVSLCDFPLGNHSPVGLGEATWVHPPQ